MIDIALAERPFRDSRHFEFIEELGTPVKVIDHVKATVRYVYLNVELDLAEDLADFLVDYGADACRAGDDGEGAIAAGDKIRSMVEAAKGPI